MNVLIVEDSKVIAEFLSESLAPYGEITRVESEAEVINIFEDPLKSFDLAILDLHLGVSQNQGLNVIEKCKKVGVTEIVVLSSFDNDELVKQAYSLGANDYFTKVQIRTNIDILIQSFLAKFNKNSIDSIFTKDYITSDEKFINELKTIVSPHLISKAILITGQTGSGKTKLAEIIHNLSGLKGNFVNVNSAEIQDGIIESELFGHVKGAFTGANKNKRGKLALAHNGTLFLDEIANMPANVQQKILKAIEEKKFYPVGGEKPVKSNFRVICATKENMFRFIKNGSFREDLFFRLSSLTLTIKPLKDKKNDIPILVREFIKSCLRKITIEKKAIKILMEYSWPGNVRELKNLIENLSIKKSGIIKVEDLPDYIISNDSASSLEKPKKILTTFHINFAKRHGMKKLMECFEEELIKNSYYSNNMKVERSARELRISKSTFYRIEKRIPEIVLQTKA